MIRFETPAPERELYLLRPLPGTEGKATFAVSAAVLGLLGLSPEQAARLDLGDVLRLIHEQGA
ncbi:hypothetical protein AB0F32_07845 [Streptomyces albidoflavus]|uniref:Uncharacterized protein n=1 Tax=Streptomyces albidoflavus TaxID=1886 RepID=A0A8G1ZPW0_9ACTN|nr:MULTISPECIES: hypothetical protein [Streptomyces]KUL59601.1 hypothetical protein ADL32_19335 [Streptomyces albidoflavus]MEE1723812.1 hypothetical protein [Streptomyces sp. JV186]RZE21901.1 hypothetical protein C0Q92_16720 [Streptomyces albidoflavus]RZE42736.1 hypothetical protein C0Q95_15795 [Streptomyces albidoflavus]UNR58011.1 hypothetical protein IPZ55_16345 [Streptomyces sp. A10(2020)]